MKSYFFRGLPIYFPLLCAKTKVVGSDLHDLYSLLSDRLERTYGTWDLELGRCCVEMHYGIFLGTPQLLLYWLSRDCARNWGRFPFNQNAGFEFSTTSRSEWNGIFKKFRKQGNLARYTQIFNFFSWKFSFQSTLLPENQQFPEFLETFPGNFCTICRRFQILESFGWMESARCLPCV